MGQAQAEVRNALCCARHDDFDHPGASGILRVGVVELGSPKVPVLLLKVNCLTMVPWGSVFALPLGECLLRKVGEFLCFPTQPSQGLLPGFGSRLDGICVSKDARKLSDP